MKTRSFVSLFALVFAVLALFSSAFAQGGPSSIYNLPAEPLHQISGGPGAMAYQPTYAAAVVIDPSQGITCKLNGVSGTSATCTVTTPNVGGFGQFLVTICAAAGGTVTYTFSGNWLPTATVAPTIGKSISVLWVSDGTVWRELSRSASAQ